MLALACGALVPTALAACPKQDVPHGGGEFFGHRWLVTYDGTVGDRFPVRMTLVFNGDVLKGKYFYIRTLKDIHVEGMVSNDRSLTLDELDEKGALTARFSGEFVERDPKGSYGPSAKLRCEVMAGKWTDFSSGKHYSFYLRLRHAVIGELSNRYRSWNLTTDDHTVEELAERFLHAVRANRREKVAALIHYPFQVHLDEKGLIDIASEPEFLQNYDAILSPSYKRNLEKAIPKHMFVDKNGFIMLGDNGSPWIGPDLKIWLP